MSDWVIGYILGVEWEDVTVAYTDNKYPERNSYQGTYMATTADATPFEAMLAQVGDHIIEYETNRYRQQRLVAFSNWPTTDPFSYTPDISDHFLKCATVTWSISGPPTPSLSGYFASYHVYPYYPDYLNYLITPTGSEIQENTMPPSRACPSWRHWTALRSQTSGPGRKYQHLLHIPEAAERPPHHPCGHLRIRVSTGRGMAQRTPTPAATRAT